MVKTRSCDVSQDLEAAMPVRDLSVKEEILEDAESGSSQRRTEKDDSYPPQSGSGWGRELRNRFVFNNNERDRTSTDYTLRSRYTEQAVGSRRRHLRSCRVSVSLDERGHIYEEDEMMEDSDDIAMFEEADDDDDDDDDDIFTPVKRRERVRRQRSRRRNLRASLSLRQKTSSAADSSRSHHVNHTGARTKPMRTHALEVEVEEEEEEEEIDTQGINGHDSSSEKHDAHDNQEGEGVRRSTRQRKLIYDNFNTSWILGTQTLRGYPMFLSVKEPVGTRVDKGLRQEEVEQVGPGEEQDDVKEVHKKRRTLSELEPAVIDDGYEDMYSRVKRPRRPVQGMMYSPQKNKPHQTKLMDGSEEEPTETQSSRSSTDDESGADGPTGKYHLRKTKPTVDRFQANVDPPRRSSRILRSVLCSSVRRRRHHGPARDASSSSSSDEERFDRKKNKGRTKTRNSIRCLPLNFNATAIPASSNHARGPVDHKQIVSTLADVDPMSLDRSIRFCHVGGLESHIRCLKEMVVFPMLYREVFEKFHIQPPKGVLFHGPPGTGKTLIARALANECSQGDRKVSFFMRKGADCLSKWVGESERQLRLLFEQAYQKRPSIIFFDEIDGLAPVRSSKQDQIHASIVSTLLALMDGLDNRGEIIVIGATNRIDAIDPALRRPGRFDRELYFPLPAKKERQEILRIHVSQWEQPPSAGLLSHLAEQAVGYCGSDLRALCSEAVIQGLRRRYPQIYKSSQKLLLDPNAVKVERVDFIRARCHIVPASHRVMPNAGRKLSAFIEPLLKKPLDHAIRSLKESFPQGISRSVASNSKIVGTSRTIHRPRLLLVGSSPRQGQTSHLGPSLLHHMEHVAVHTLDLSSLFEVSGRTPEEACIQWWSLVPETLHAVFLSHLCKLDPSAPILLIATADVPYNALPNEVRSLFSEYRDEVLVMQDPPASDRESFFKPLFITEAVRPPKEPRKVSDHLEELPLAPPPEPLKLTEEELKALYEKEEATLRELRIFLREICAKLARNRQFFMFTKPVDIQEVPDYLTIIKQPMDLETMMTKIDLHRYVCAQDFLDDVDLLCHNALEYNPDRDPADKLIRHRACSLRDTAYTLIKAEMDSDFEEQCKEISRARRHRAESPSRFAPEFVRTKPWASQVAPDEGESQKNAVLSKESQGVATKEEEAKSVNQTSVPTCGTNGSPGMRKRVWKFGGSGSENSRPKKRRTWARGFIKAKNKKMSMRRIVSSFPPHASNHTASPSSTNASTESSCASLMQDTSSQGHKEDRGPWRIDDAFQDASKEFNTNDSNLSKNCLLVVNGEHLNSTASPTLFADVALAKTESSNEENQDVSQTLNRCLTPMSSHCQSISESFIEDTLNDNDAADDLISFCDGASQDDAGEIVSKQCISVLSSQYVEKQTDLGTRTIEIDVDELKHLLARAVKITKHCQVETLVELYIQLNKCVIRHSKLWTRTSLPQELEKELSRFEEHSSSDITAS
ncbi:ATPase family AAA domain-containing protein 2B [Zootermopsis nevadensis]|uniref:Tat-binding homolog 7 n=1 Tax=Zootermopsis nevadensis TaxID=136037 RepID=A0A067R7M2_ZOONE|nr:ATPase family AAA domain-containing protein 2B [Zootermopsis nevadensis]